MSGPQTPEVDVVIVTWKGRELLASCLDHLRRQTERAHVIVVDNASGDGTVELVREQYPEVTLIELDENLGFGVANNLGAAAGSAEFIVLLNNDVDAEPRFVERCVHPLRSDGRCGAVAALTTRPGSGLVDQFGVQLDRGFGAYARGTGQDPDDVRVGALAAPCAGAAAYRREAFEQVGGFDPALFAYSEDLDLGLRLLAAGWHFAEAPDARGIHHGGASNSVSPVRRRLGAFGRGFIYGRYRIGSWRGRLHALMTESAAILWGGLRHRTLVPLTARLHGLRAARQTPRRALPPGVVDEQIGLREALRRLAGGA